MHMFFERIFFGNTQVFLWHTVCLLREGENTQMTNQWKFGHWANKSKHQWDWKIHRGFKREGRGEEEEENTEMDHSYRKVTKHDEGEVSWWSGDRSKEEPLLLMSWCFIILNDRHHHQHHRDYYHLDLLLLFSSSSSSCLDSMPRSPPP